MNYEKYNFNEFCEDDARHSLAQKAKILLKQNISMPNAYQSHRKEFFGITASISYLMDLHKDSFVLKSQKKFIDEVKRSRASKRFESKKQNPSTPVKTNRNNFTAFQPKHLSFDNIPNELSESVTKTLKKQLSTAKEILRATESENSLQEEIPVSALSEVSPNVSASRRQQSTPVKVNRNATELESFPNKHLPPGHKRINYADLVALKSNKISTHRAVLNLSTKIGSDHINPIVQDHETVGPPEGDEGKPEKSDQTIYMFCMSNEKVKKNISPYKEVGVDDFHVTDCGKNNRPMVKDTALKLSTPVRVNINAPEPESLPGRHLLLGHEEIINSEPVYRDFMKSFDNSKKIDIGSENVNPFFQDLETVGEPDGDRGKPEKSDDAVNMSYMFSENVKRNPSPYKEVRVHGVPTRNKTTSRENPTASDNQNPFCSTRESPRIFQTSMSGTKEFSPAKIAKMSDDSDTKSHISPSFDEKAEILMHSNEDNKMTISPNERINIFKSCERKRKSPSPRKDSVQSSSIPRFIHPSCAAEIETGMCFLSIDYPTPTASSIQCRSIKRSINVSRTAEIDTDVSSVSTGNPNPAISSISLIDPKSVKVTMDNKDQDKFRKVTTFGGNESNLGTSRDICLSAKDSTTNPSSVSGNKNSSIGDVLIDLERDRYSYEILLSMHIKKCPIKTLSARVIQNLDREILEYCITEFKNLLSLRNQCFKHIYSSLTNLKNSLELLCHHIEVTLNFFLDISILRADYVSETLQQNIYTLIVTATKLVNELEELKIYAALDLQNWVINFYRNDKKIYPHCKALKYNGKPSINLEYLHALENHIKLIWVLLDEEIKNAECKRLYFLSTEKDVLKFINMFVECLIMVGILKP